MQYVHCSCGINYTDYVHRFTIRHQFLSKFQEAHLSARGSSLFGNTPHRWLLHFLESFLAVLSVYTLHLFSFFSKGLQISVSLGTCIWNPIYQGKAGMGSTQQSLCSESPCIVTDAMPKSCILARAICFLVNASLKDRPVDLLDELQMIRCMQVLSVA